MKSDSVKRKRGRPAGSQADKLINVGAIKAFTKYGFNNCTVAHILEESGCSRTNFYRIFKSKEDVFTRLISDSFQMFEDRIRESFSDIGKYKTLESQLEQSFTIHYEMCFSYGDLITLMFDTYDAHPEHRYLSEGLRSKQINFLVMLLKNNGHPVPDLLLIDAIFSSTDRILKVLAKEKEDTKEKTRRAVALTMAICIPALANSHKYLDT